MHSACTVLWSHAYIARANKAIKLSMSKRVSHAAMFSLVNSHASQGLTLIFLLGVPKEHQIKKFGVPSQNQVSLRSYEIKKRDIISRHE